jgi:hypothetical protein
VLRTFSRQIETTTGPAKSPRAQPARKLYELDHRNHLMLCHGTQKVKWIEQACLPIH